MFYGSRRLSRCRLLGGHNCRQRRVAAIHDLSGFGRCSLTVALPIISAMGMQCCPLPTALLSNHTGYPSYSFLELTEEMGRFTEEWAKLDLRFDGIYSGFLGSSDQIHQVEEFLKNFHHSKCLYVCDPVLGDHGKAYATCGPDLWEGMRNLVRQADVITPNLTEVFLMTGEPYDPDISVQRLIPLIRNLIEDRPIYVAVTGIERNGEVCNLAYDGVHGGYELISRKKEYESYAGTGDVFASVLTAAMTRQENFTSGVKKAADFVSRAVALSHKAGIPVTDGVCFEPLLNRL